MNVAELIEQLNTEVDDHNKTVFVRHNTVTNDGDGPENEVISVAGDGMMDEATLYYRNPVSER